VNASLTDSSPARKGQFQGTNGELKRGTVTGALRSFRVTPDKVPHKSLARKD